MSVTLFATIISIVALVTCRPLTLASRLSSVPLYQHLFFGATAIVALIWSLKYTPHPLLTIHFLCATTLTLLLGARLALMSLALVILIFLLTTGAGLNSWGLSFVIWGIIPVTFSRASLLLSQKFLPRHLFIYLLVNGFITGALAILLTLIAQYLAFIWITGGDWQSQLTYLNVTPLLMFPEGLLNGMAITLLAVYKPHWLKTYDDRIYLNEGKD
ncbi:energy-coupling factor ABC transporter permease [Corallincola platygyrae]|uniref:Energy-coupling factor ABC transporter permease n=1 Tax=Corallincola platygyrae TaxID=1193278 RepID=A0ABW4XKG3_9GAMM